RARAAADVLDGEEVVLHTDLDVAAHVLLVLDRVGPVVLGVERIRPVGRVAPVDRTGAARSTGRSGELVVLRAGRGVPRNVDHPARALEHAGGARLLAGILLHGLLVRSDTFEHVAT